MILITGGAGFVGSNLAISLLEKGVSDITICDQFGDGDKWQNLRKHAVMDVVSPDNLFDYLEKYKDEIELIFHMGGISSTTETNVDLLLKYNFVLSCRLWDWCSENKVRFIYSSSSHTYGAGENGFKDDDSVEALSKLKPMTPFGWSKQLFDVKAARRAALGKERPPQWVGVKLFDLYGPNEYHKDIQQSVLAQKFPRAERSLRIPLYRSQNPSFKDGEQMRDFLYVKDACDMLYWFYEHPELNGIYNIGSGKASTFLYMTECLFKAIGKKSQIEFIDMPPELAERYQYFTEADITKLRNTGYKKPVMSLEEGVKDYITSYLDTEDAFR